MWNLISISSRYALDKLSPAFLQAHGHAQIFGWIGTFILGIGFYSLTNMGHLPAFSVRVAGLASAYGLRESRCAGSRESSDGSGESCCRSRRCWNWQRFYYFPGLSPVIVLRPRPSGMHPSFPFFVRLAYLWLLVAAALSVRASWNDVKAASGARRGTPSP